MLCEVRVVGEVICSSLDRSCFNVWFVMPDAHAWSVYIGVSACGWPISMKTVRRGVPS
jgi:hypothetical protein